MRRIQASDAKAQFDTLLKDVERGETVTIDRDGKPVARIVPANDHLVREPRSPERQAEIERAIANIKTIAKRNGPITVEEILSARDEGRK